MDFELKWIRVKWISSSFAGAKAPIFSRISQKNSGNMPDFFLAVCGAKPSHCRLKKNRKPSWKNQEIRPSGSWLLFIPSSAKQLFPPVVFT